MTDPTAPVLLTPDWPVPPGVHALSTTRRGGVSGVPYDSFNLGMHVGDEPAAVAANRHALRACLPAEPVWLEQVHGTDVVDAAAVVPGVSPRADAAFTHAMGVPCVVMTADCLPVLFASRNGQTVAAAHTGWRGLVDGVLEATIRAMGVAPDALIAWLGPAIGPAHFEVGPEVRDVFVRHSRLAVDAFVQGTGDRWMMDIFALARQRLQEAGMAGADIHGGGVCTVSQAKDFFSYRRDRVTGRMATLIWRT